MSSGDEHLSRTSSNPETNAYITSRLRSQNSQSQMETPHLPPSVHQNILPNRRGSHSPSQNPPSHLQSLLQDALVATQPSLRHLASHSSLGSQRSSNDVRSATSRATSGRPLSTTFEEQRHAGNRNNSLRKGSLKHLGFPSNTKLFEPAIKEELGHADGDAGISDELTLFERGSADCRVSRTEGLEEKPLAEKKHSKEDLKDENEIATAVAEDDENNYPKPLGLFILITGIALSVFLISLDRTIITTAIPFISAEFQSYDDIGWYGSGYLLTASAFQPLYGRIFQLFNIKWSYLAALGMFELGSLICGVAPNSLALIVGRAIAGLGSAGILTGSFVVVSHAVPLQKRPVLTAVVGLMFGVGATAGPLLGGVFTDLVTWRWCFYFNLPVGGATAAAMIFFFHPPKKHAMMSKSFFYRTMELDLTGNVILLGASVMLFLALQLTEQRVPWRSAEVIGLLTGSGLAFTAFAVWQWWKADGALMPPRILKQRTVAASCAVGFFIYSAILIHTYYLPMYFQGVEGDSAIHSGVNMIPYVTANALFSLLAGIFVSKNGYFTAPAIVGMVIGTVGAGLLATLQVHAPAAKWIGYEILASAGIGMAIQQGFTAVQIVLPLDEVAVGTAAVVAFQSLGGAIFVSVGNTILQNSLYEASASNALPGVDIQAVLDAGASDFRRLVPADVLGGFLTIYNDALRKVFIAAIPMAGLAVVAACFMEWRNVNDTKREDEEAARKAHQKRSEVEEAMIEAARKERNGTGISSDEENWRKSWNRPMTWGSGKETI